MSELQRYLEELTQILDALENETRYWYCAEPDPHLVTEGWTDSDFEREEEEYYDYDADLYDWESL